MSHYNISTVTDFFKAMYGDSTEHNVEIRICDNVRGRSFTPSIFTRKPAEIDTYLNKYTSPDKSTYFGVCTRRKGATTGKKVDVVEMPALWVDIDCDKDGISREDVANAFKQSKYPPSILIESGGGLHAYWILTEAEIIETPEDQKRVEIILKKLANIYAGDTTVCEVARIMRLPGSLNTKEATIERYGEAVPCEIMIDTEARSELGDVEEWLDEQTTMIERPAKEGELPVNKQEMLTDPYSIFGSEFKANAPMDVDTALKTMSKGKEGATIHETQLKVTGSLIRRGIEPQKVLDRVLEATVKAAGKAGTKWDWDAEDKAIKEMIVSAQQKLATGEWEKHVPKILQSNTGELVSDDWHDDLVKGGKEGDTILPKLVNAVILLDNRDGFEGGIAYNEMSNRTMLMKAIPSHSLEGDLPREWKDNDDTRLQSWFESSYMMVAKATVTDAVGMVAEQNSFNPLKDRLNGLEWDGVKRIDNWLHKYMGVEEDTFTTGVGRKFLISAVARGLNPGCKVDTMLVLEGDQGLFKSTACSVLCMEKDWFGDNMPDVSDRKAAQEYIQGKWLVEVAELNAMSKAESIKTKSFLSSPIDRYRASYGRYSHDYPRGCVFIATMNPEGGYLEDATGARRFWPVKVGIIDLVSLKNDVEQLWAEAVCAFKDGENWWLDSGTDIDAAAKQAQDARHFDDLWLPYVEKYITHSPTIFENGNLKSIDMWSPRAKEIEYIVITDLLTDALGKPVSSVNKMDRNRVGKILTYMGWKNTTVRVGNNHIKKQQKVWKPNYGDGGEEGVELKEDFEESVF